MIVQWVKKFSAVLVMLFVCFAATGCFRIASDVTINSDGSANLAYTVTSVPMIRDYVEEMKDKALKADPSAKATPVNNGDYSGYKIESNYNTLEDLAKKGGDFFTAYDGKNKGIQRRGGWLFDAYSFDLNLTGRNPHQGQSGSKSDGFLFDFNIHLPGAPISHNADRVSDDGKTLYWDQTSVLLSGSGKSMQVTFRIWHTFHVIVTVIVAAAAVGAALVGFLKIRTGEAAEPEERKKWTAAAAVGAVVFLVIAGYSAVSAFSKDTFTDENIISNRYTTTGASLKKGTGGSQAKPAAKPAGNAGTAKKALGKKDAAAPKAPAVDTATPEGVFKQYHQFITDRKYQQAFQCFSPSMQSVMGDYQSWSRGYSTTISSIPENVQVTSNDGSTAVLSFRLKATDRDGAQNKVQYFKGTCRLIRDNGNWKIDEISAQLA